MYLLHNADIRRNAIPNILKGNGRMYIMNVNGKDHEVQSDKYLLYCLLVSAMTRSERRQNSSIISKSSMLYLLM